MPANGINVKRARLLTIPTNANLYSWSHIRPNCRKNIKKKKKLQIIFSYDLWWCDRYNRTILCRLHQYKNNRIRTSFDKICSSDLYTNLVQSIMFVVLNISTGHSSLRISAKISATLVLKRLHFSDWLLLYGIASDSHDGCQIGVVFVTSHSGTLHLTK